jgi:hypothetical protein
MGQNFLRKKRRVFFQRKTAAFLAIAKAQQKNPTHGQTTGRMNVQ